MGTEGLNLIKNQTWSSRVSSQNAGINLAHSTSISSCLLIDSTTSSTVATRFCERSMPDDGEGNCNSKKTFNKREEDSH